MSGPVVSVAPRRCPDCGGELLGRAGLAWLTCRACPLALDPFRVPVEKLVTYRPDGEKAEGAARLAFWVFETGPEASSAWIWIPAFRVVDFGPNQGAWGALTQRAYRPILVEAPLGAGLARGPEAALALAKLLRKDAFGGAEVPSPWLVSLPCGVSGDLVTEPVSGVTVSRRGLRPPLGSRPG